MSLGGVLLMHTVAHGENKAPLFFSRFNFQRMKERGNTHYCFHCGGHYGFTPGRGGEVTNQMDNKITLKNKAGEEVLIKDALNNANLEPHIANSEGYPRYKPEDGRYEDWLKYEADFDYDPTFVRWCESNGYVVHRHDPMKNHDSITHANAVVGGANRFNSASQWLEDRLPNEFPYIVGVT